MVFPAHCRVHELQNDIFAYAFEIAISPVLERIGGSFSSAFLGWTIIAATRRMRVDFIGWTPHDVDTAAVCPPARYSRGEVFVDIRNSTIVFLFKCVVGRIRVGIAPLPESLDKLLTLFVGIEVEKAAALFGSYDVDHVLVEPLPILGI